MPCRVGRLRRAMKSPHSEIHFQTPGTPHVPLGLRHCCRNSLVAAAPIDISEEASQLSARAMPLLFQTVGDSGVSVQQMFFGTSNKARHPNIFFRS